MVFTLVLDKFKSREKLPRAILFLSVKTSLACVTVLEWNQSGNYLLIGDSAGYAEIWTTLTHLLNEWTKVAHICIPDEPIQAGTFFNNGKRVHQILTISPFYT